MFSGDDEHGKDSAEEESRGGESEELEKKYNGKSTYSAGIKNHHHQNESWSSTPDLTSSQQRKQNRKIFSTKRQPKSLQKS